MNVKGRPTDNKCREATFCRWPTCAALDIHSAERTIGWCGVNAAPSGSTLFHCQYLTFGTSELTLRHTIAVDDRELIDRRAPIPYRHRPLLADLGQRQIKQFHHRLDARERRPVLDYLPQRHVQRLDGIGSVNRSPNLFWKTEHRN